MQYIAMLKRMPEATLRERFNNNDSIVVGGVGTVPFPNADHYVQERQLSLAYNPRAGVTAPGSVLSPARAAGGQRFPAASGAAAAGSTTDKKILPSAVPVEAKPTILQMEMLLKALSASTADCVTTNDYAVKLYQNLDRYFDLSAEISGTAIKLRRAFGTVGFSSAEDEKKAREAIKAKLGATDGSPSSLADAQKKLAKAYDRIRDMSETIERLRGVKTDIALLQDRAKQLRETCASVKQTARFQLLDMQDFLTDQSARLRTLVGTEALRGTGVAGGGINAAKKALLDAEIKKMKDENPLRDAAAVLRLTLESTLDEMRRVLRAPLDPSKPVEDSDDDDGKPNNKKKASGGAKGNDKEPPRRVKPNCAAQAIKHEIRLPKVDLQHVGWDTLKVYDKPGTELDLLKEAKFSLKVLLQMQKLMSQWYVDHSQSTSTINGLRHEVDALTQQLATAKEEAANSASALASAAKASAASSAASAQKATSSKKPPPEAAAPTTPAAAPPSGKEGAKAGKAAPASSGSPKSKPAAPPSKAAKPSAKGTPKTPVPAAVSFETAATESEGGAAGASTTTPTITSRPGTSFEDPIIVYDGEDTIQSLPKTGTTNSDTEGGTAAAVTTPILRPLSATHRGGVDESFATVDGSLPASPLLTAAVEGEDMSPTAAAGGVVEAPSLSRMQSPTRDALPPLTSGLDDIANSIHATNGGSKVTTTTTSASSSSALKNGGVAGQQRRGSIAKKNTSSSSAVTKVPSSMPPPVNGFEAASTSGGGGIASGRTSSTTTPRVPGGGGAANSSVTSQSQHKGSTSSDLGDARSNASQSISPALTPGRAGGGALLATTSPLDTVRLQSLFLEIGALGIPKRLGILLESVFKILFPGDPRIAMLRSGVIVNEKDNEVFQRLSRHHLPSLNASPLLSPPPPTDLLPPNLVGSSGDGMSLGGGEGDPLHMAAAAAASADSAPEGSSSLVSQPSMSKAKGARRYSRAATSSTAESQVDGAAPLSRQRPHRHLAL
ncbi:Hypothetical protein, putative [Bodo saltans]|uniref:Uncharacterized protein n=1 Tax=Bodo saltans TaxID=75058 RepID=A0A0S4JGC5_BODSA|nr:Hypothetical protein, putative [Bodo saltans]|eukprot:CUG90538.1 Hypothetical protein, putative [Bodo saltans]